LKNLENELLLCHAYGITRTELHTHPARYNDQDTRYKELINRRQKHEPIAYIIGNQPFLGLDIIVTPDVLIPRPETEYMTNLVIKKAVSRMPLAKIADIGTGSGCIAVALAKYLPESFIYAIDSSEKALEVAEANAKKHDVLDRIKFLKGHLLEPLKEKVDLIISNPPYIPTSDIPSLMPDVRDFEPISALDGGPDGLQYIRELISVLSSQSSDLILEFGFNQAPAVLELARQKFPQAEMIKDQFGLERFLCYTQ
jgi:release factor glutamine methyltransferase